MEKRNIGTKGASKWKEVIIGGVSGIALGAAGSIFASSMPNENSDEANGNVEDNAEAENAAGTAQMATKVTDSMSFSEAFDVARGEVGAGGVFEWHGNLYGTYTADEWNNMDGAARDEYAESIHWDGPSHEYVAPNNHSHASHTSHSSQATHSENVHQAANTTANQSGGNQNQEEEEDLDIEIIGVEHANIDGEHESIIGTASVNGQAVYFVDIDGEDDEFELMMSDHNGNNQIEENEVVDISEQHMSVSHFEQMAQANESTHANENEEPVQYYANDENLPDYVNDADPGTLA